MKRALGTRLFNPRRRRRNAGEDAAAGAPARPGTTVSAPLIATALFTAYKSRTPIALDILVTAIISIVATMFLKDYTGKDVSAEYDAVESERREAA